MDKQEMIDMVAKEMAKQDKRFNDDYVRIVHHKNATIAVDMFWPLVEAAEKVTDDSYCTDTSCLDGRSALSCIECSSELLRSPLSNLKGEPK